MGVFWEADDGETEGEEYGFRLLGNSLDGCKGETFAIISVLWLS